jgi:hypothetical protein
MSFTKDKFVKALLKAGVPSSQIDNALDDLATQTDTGDSTAGVPKLKPILVRQEGDEFARYIMCIREDENPKLIPDKLRAAARAYNITRRGKSHPVSTFEEAMYEIPLKTFKEHGISLSPKAVVPEITVPAVLVKEDP